jgi:peptide/nickel transport system substrate-binding protein
MQVQRGDTTSSRFVVAVLTVALLASLLTSVVLTPTAEVVKGPRADTIVYVGVTTTDKGIKGVETGEFDAFMWEVLPDDLEKVGADLSKLRLIPAVRFVDLLDINAYSDPNEMGACGLATRPRDGVVVFNPFAIREIRFQLNNLINRKYISYELLKGGGEPAITYISVSHPAWRYIKEVVDRLGLREEGNELLALQRIRGAMVNASKCVEKFGYSIALEKDPTTGREVWTLRRPDGSKEPIKIVFLIRIEDERKLIGDYIAGQLEKAGFLVERKYIERAQVRPLVRSAEPRNLDWHLYTHSDAMIRSVWIHEEVGWYSAEFASLPTTGGLWEYTAEHARKIGDYIQERVEQIARELYRGQVKDVEEYWAKIKEGTYLGIYQSLRVFIIGVRNFYVVNPRVRDMVYSPVFGITIEWPWRTAITPDSTIRVALYASTGSLFLYEWNPISGVGGVYGSYIWYYVRDYAWLRHPSTLEPVPVRATWKVERKNVTVPTTAIMYDPNKHSWVSVPEGRRASYVLEFNFKFSNYHDGSPQTLLDVLTNFAWFVEWAFKSGDDDVWYHKNIESDKYIAEDVVGIEIINSTAIRVYGNYGLFYSLDETATYYLGYLWPSWHPLLRLAFEYVVLYGGPVSGVKYGWLTREGEKTLDAMNPEHVADVAEALRIIGRGGYSPPHLASTIKVLRDRGVQVQDIGKAAESLAKFITERRHMAVSNGPYYISRYVPEQMYIELKAFRDPTYPFTPDYWLKAFEVSQLRVAGAIKVPTIIVAGYSAEVEVPVVKYVIFPDEGTREAVDVGAELAILGAGGSVIATVPGRVKEVGPPTVWVFTVGPDVTKKLSGLKTVDIEVRFWRRPGLYDISERFRVEVLSVETPTPTPTAMVQTLTRTVVSTVTVTTVSPRTVPVEVTPVITPAGAGIAVAALVIGILIGTLVLRRR